jgi:hypothetical protein
LLSPEVIGAIRALLARVQIAGAEVPAFNRVMIALDEYEKDLRRKQQAPPTSPSE